MKPEEKIEYDTCRQAKRYGFRIYKLTFIGWRGAPDRVFGRLGQAKLIEFKKPGEVPTTQQLIRHQQLRSDFGFDVYWTDNYAGACRILGIPT